MITKEVYKTGERIHLLKEQKFDFPIKFWVEKKREKELVGLFRGGSEDVKRAIEEWEGVFQSIEISALEADPFIFHSVVIYLLFLVVVLKLVLIVGVCYCWNCCSDFTFILKSPLSSPDTIPIKKVQSFKTLFKITCSLPNASQFNPR